MLIGTPETVSFVPINRIEILNFRDRNMKVFEEIVDNIRAIGLKSPSPWPNARETTASCATCWSAARGDSMPSAFWVKPTSPPWWSM
jgi:hypothetical protein